MVVVGAGFAGASLLRHLPPVLRRPGETLLIDRRDEFAFVPLIHEVAVGRVHPDSVSSPIAPLCSGACEFLNTEVVGIDLDEKIVETRQGRIGYEYLILNPGSVAAEPAPRLREYFQPFWRLEDALRLRRSLGDAWRVRHEPGSPASSRHPDRGDRRRWGHRRGASGRGGRALRLPREALPPRAFGRTAGRAARGHAPADGLARPVLRQGREEDAHEASASRCA